MKKVYGPMGLLAAGFLACMLLLLVFSRSAAASPYASTVVHLPFVTSPVVPTESYETDFENSIEPWKMVRWQKGGSYDLDHDSGCDNGHCGILELDVDKEETYAIASPLILGPNRPYVIEFRAKLDDPKDKHQYGVVLGADWNDGGCPGDNTDSCFNHYYEFRVRFRDEGGEKYLEYRLRRVDGHDGNNVEEGKDLVEWTRVTVNGVNAEDWNKWSVRYSSRHNFTFKINNDELGGSAEDSKYDDPLYFGVMARASENGDARAQFTSFSIAIDQ
ncbi:MAG: hypothetical protein ACK2UK_18585 [Candidatus Promineifilaceae bacterium]